MRRRIPAVVTAYLPSSAACLPSPTLPDIHPPCPLGYLLAIVVGMERALKSSESGKLSFWKVVASRTSSGRGMEQRTTFPSLPWARAAMWLSSNQWTKKRKETRLSLFATAGSDSIKRAFLGSRPQPRRHTSPRLSLFRKRNARVS